MRSILAGVVVRKTKECAGDGFAFSLPNCATGAALAVPLSPLRRMLHAPRCLGGRASHYTPELPRRLPLSL